MRFPLQAPLAARQIDGDLILYDPWNGSVHRLNSVAGLIWRLCNGAREPGAITSEVAALFWKPAADVAPDVNAILTRFADSGLIHSAGSPRRETELLVRCVRTAIGTEGTEWIGDLLGEDVDWAYLVQTALQHGVMPLLYRSLRANPRRAVPVSVLDRLRRNFHRNARWNLFVTRELLEILALFEAHRIPAMPLKGPVLAVAAHGSVALRQFGDLDIFVPADQAADAKKLLIARGYRFQSSGETDAFAECARRDGTVGVELQWALAPKRFRNPIDLAQLWGRLEPVSLGSATVWQPPPADQALILCAHAAKHCWSTLGLIADFAAFARVHEHRLDWRCTVDRAGQLGGERLLLLGLRLAGDVLGTDVPAEVLPRMHADTVIASLAAELRQGMFAAVRDPTHFQGSYGFDAGGLLYIRTRERVRDKVPYALHLLGRSFRRFTAITPNHHDRAVVALPNSVAFLYYLIRPIRLARKYGVRLVQRYGKRTPVDENMMST